MIKNYLKPLIVCFGVLWAVNSCTDNEATQIPFSEIQPFKNTFSLKDFKDNFIRENLIIHWEDFNLQQDPENNSSIYEFNTSLKVKNTLQNGKNTLAVTYKLLAFQDDSGNPSFELLKFLSTNNPLNNISYFNTANFSGTLYHYNVKGENTKIKAYKNGVLINEFTGEKTGVINAQSKAPEVGGCEEGCYVLVFTDHYTDYYLSINGSPFSYGYSVFKGTTSEWVWISGSGGGGYGGSAPSYHHHFDDPHGPNIGSDNHAEEHIIIDLEFSQNYPCQSNIVQQAYGNCTPLSQLFQNIFESNDKVNVTFTAEDINNIFWGGYTEAVIGNPLNYTITLNTERLSQSTELDIVNVAVHEYIHAILNYFYQAGGFQLTGAGTPPTYAELVEGFTQYRADFYSEFTQHQYMTALTHDIAEVTYDWAINYGSYNPDDFAAYDNDPGDGIDGLKEFLRTLAWSGLTNTSTFETLYPDNTLEEQAIQKLIQDEIFPTDADATPKGNMPVPCNN